VDNVAASHLELQANDCISNITLVSKHIGRHSGYG
jgi:hypothetical protein